MPSLSLSDRIAASLAERADDTGRIAGRNTAGRQIVRDDAAGPDGAPVADRDPRQYDRPAADPHAVADADRLGALEPGGAGRAIERMGRRVKLHRRAHLKIIADLDRRAVEEHAVVVDEGALPDADIIAVIAGKPGLDIGPVAERPEQLA